MVSKYRSAKGGQLILETYDELVKAWDVAVTEEDVNTPYGRTHLIEAGDAQSPPLLLFHGVGDDSALMWLLNAKELVNHFHIFAVDTIGGPGKSEPNAEYFKSFDQAKWIDAVLDAKELGSVYLVGVSMGAGLTQHYTAKRPERVIKAVCMAGSIAVKGRRGSPLQRMMKVFLPEALFPSEENAKKLIRKLSGDPESIDAIIQKLPVFLKHYVYLLKYFNNRSMSAHSIDGFDDREIGVIRGKTRILIGACDRLAQGSEAYELLKEYDLSHHIVENAGHALNMEKPELVNGEIVSFLLGGAASERSAAS